MPAKRAALYIRVSTEEQARHGYSLGEQRADLESFAASRNFAVIGIYADEGVSARKAMSRRKELQRLLADVEAGRVDVIVIKCLDRWFRNVADFYKVQEILDAHHVEWACTQEEIDTSTTGGRLMLNMRLSIAQHESDQTSDRIKYVNEGKRRRREAVSGKVPLGVSVREKRFVPNDQAPAVLDLFRYIAAGRTKRSAIAYMQETHGIALTFEQVSLTLKNRLYLGERQGEAGYMEPIVPQGIFARVQELLSRNIKAAPTGRIYLFSGLIRCPYCGNALHGRRGHRSRVNGEYLNFRYGCLRNSMNGKNSCSYGGGVFEKAVENFLLENIQRLAQEHMFRIEEERKRGGRDAKARLSEARGKLRRLKELYVAGMIDMGEYRKDYEELSAQERELSALAAREPRISPEVERIASMEDIRASYSILPRQQKKDLWQSIIDRIEFDNTPAMRKAHGKKEFRVFFC